ncbi:MAG: toxin-antitoxin system YwqK family antitoxin [Myxococcota bacterium]
MTRALVLLASVALLGCGDEKRPGKRGPKRLSSAVAKSEPKEADGPTRRTATDDDPPRRRKSAVGEVSCPGKSERRCSAPPGGRESYCILAGRDTVTKHGPFRGWHENGALHLQGEYARGLRTGVWSVYRADGSQESESSYDQDVQDGPWTTWHANGKKSGEGRYRQGKKDGVGTFWHDNGKKKAEAKYVDDLREGPSTNWSRDGKVQSQGRYVAGKKEGPWLDVAPDGTSTQNTFKAGVAQP